MSDERLTRAEEALLKVLGFEWSDTFGCWLDTRGPTTLRQESIADALDEACASVELAAIEVSERGPGETHIVLRQDTA